MSPDNSDTLLLRVDRWHSIFDEFVTKKVFKISPFGPGARMVMPNTCPNLSDIVRTDFELGRVIETVDAADPGITTLLQLLTLWKELQ